jgi:hypothetical protein
MRQSQIMGVQLFGTKKTNLKLWQEGDKMVRCIFILLAIIVLCIGCGHGKAQIEYYQTLQHQLDLQAKQKQEEPPLLDLKLNEDGSVASIQVADQTHKRTSISIPQPAHHPVYGTIISCVESPLASILGFGVFGKMIASEVGAKMINSNNEVGGDGAFSYGGGSGIDNGIADSYNEPDDHSVRNSHNDSSQTDESREIDKSTTETHEEYWQDSHDQNWQDSHDENWREENWQDSHDDLSDNRQNYNNPQTQEGGVE